MMPQFLQRELEKDLAAAGKSLVQVPPSRDELLPLLDQIKALLSEVDQLPTKPLQNTLSPLMKALVTEDLLKHSDVDINVSVASCISEITRITAPGCPYDDDKMKDVFQLIVSSFDNLSDITDRSYEKRAAILETMAKVRSCVVMLDLECHQMITEMFQNFLKAIRDDHDDIIFASMEKIMTFVLEESEDIYPELLALLFATLKRNNEVAMPITKKLAKRVLQNSADKIRPYLKRAVTSLGTSLDDYSDVIFFLCGENTDKVEHSNTSILNNQSTAKGGREKTNLQDENPIATRSTKSIIKETMNNEIMVDANSPNRVDSDNQLDANLKIKTKCDDVVAEKPVSSEDNTEFVESQQVLYNHKSPEMSWLAKVLEDPTDSSESATPMSESKVAVGTPLSTSPTPHPPEAEEIDHQSGKKSKLLNGKAYASQSSNPPEATRRKYPTKHNQCASSTPIDVDFCPPNIFSTEFFGGLVSPQDCDRLLSLPPDQQQHQAANHFAQLGVLLSGLWNPSHLLTSPQIHELEKSLSSERKKNAAALAKIRKLESEMATMREDMEEIRFAHLAAEKEVHDMSLRPLSEGPFYLQRNVVDTPAAKDDPLVSPLDDPATTT